jgi:hypothetical protein
MGNTTISGDVREIVRVAGSTYRHATSFSFDDARNGLKYALLRLSLLGLTDQDRVQLGELARLAYQELDVTKVASEIKNSETASQLAVAIADIVDHSQGSKKMAMYGAVFGAYAALGGLSGGKSSEILTGVLGAIAGAVAVSTSKFTQDDMELNSWRNFVERD